MLIQDGHSIAGSSNSAGCWVVETRKQPNKTGLAGAVRTSQCDPLRATTHDIEWTEKLPPAVPAGKRLRFDENLARRYAGAWKLDAKMDRDVFAALASPALRENICPGGGDGDDKRSVVF
jgi:hypothetical protein